MTDLLGRTTLDFSAPETESDTIFTVPASTRYHLRNLTVVNTHASLGAWIMLSKGDITVAANQFIRWMYVPPGEHILLPVEMTFETGETLRAREIVDESNCNIWFENRVASGSTTDGTSFTTASWDTSNFAHLLTVINTHASAAGAVTSITENHGDITWTELQTVLSSDGVRRITQFRGTGTAGSSNTTTFNFGATQTSCVWIIDRTWGTGNTANKHFFAAGTRAEAASSQELYVPATMPVGARYMSVALGATVESLAAGQFQTGNPAVTTPTNRGWTYWEKTPGDQRGRAFFTSAQSNRVAALVCVQQNTVNRHVVFHGNMVEET